MRAVVTAGYFQLPTAWRSAGTGASADDSAVAGYADLAERLGTLGRACGAELSVVLAAAHIKVLSMLTEEPLIRTDVLWAARDQAVLDQAVLDQAVRTVQVLPDAAGTWRDLIGLVRQALASPDQVGGGDNPAREAGALFTTDPLACADWAAAPRYGLCVGPADGALMVRTLSVRDGCLRRLVSMYRRVLHAMADGPDDDAARACLPPDELHTVLARWGTGPAVPRGPGTVVSLFRAQAARTPDSTAVSAPGTRITYRDLDRRSDQLACHLAGLGARSESLVGVCLRRTADLPSAVLGVWKSGAAYLPLDPDLPGQRLGQMVSSAGCELIVTHGEHLPALAACTGIRFVALDSERETIAALPATAAGLAAAGPPPGPAQLAYVLYTSGSTGAPKGVMVHHGALANYLLWTVETYAARGTGGSAFFTSTTFDLGIPSLLTPLLTGQRVQLLPDPLDTADLGRLLAAGAPYSFLKMTPGHLNLLSLDLEPAQAHGLAGLVIAAGDAFPAELARRWAELAGPGGTPVATEYGPTEITVGNSGQLVTGHGQDGLIPLGAPIPNTSIYVLTSQCEPVPIGVPGEVYVGGAGVSRGYLRDPALTAQRFVPDPHGAAGTRLYRTGDRARWQPSGSLEFLGRTDHQVKVRGYRVELREVEQALRRLACVSEAVVVACEQPSRSARLAAFVLPAPGQAVEPSRLRAGLAAELPEYMIPAEIVTVGDIPLTANGKVDVRALQGVGNGVGAHHRPGPGSPKHSGEDCVTSPTANRSYQVVMNREDQYSLWDADRDPPDGWHPDGFTGSKQECLGHIAEVWTDMRPLSARNGSRVLTPRR